LAARGVGGGVFANLQKNIGNVLPPRLQSWSLRRRGTPFSHLFAKNAPRATASATHQTEAEALAKALFLRGEVRVSGRMGARFCPNKACSGGKQGLFVWRARLACEPSKASFMVE